MEPKFSKVACQKSDRKKRICMSLRGSRNPFAQILLAAILLFLFADIASAQTNLPDKYGIPFGAPYPSTQAVALQVCQNVLAGYVDPLNSRGPGYSGSVKTPCTFYLGNPGTYTYAYCAEYNYSTPDENGYQGVCIGWNAGLQSMQPAKNLGSTCNCAGDPINVLTGNEYRDEEDASLGDLSLHRYYNSDASMTSSHIGAHWRHSFDRSLVYQPSTIPATATMVRANGVQKVFRLLGTGQWTPDADVADSLTPQTDASGTIIGWVFFDAATRNHENYDASGNLVSITDPSGQVTALSYSTSSTPTTVAPAAGLLLTVTNPQGRTLSFTYNAQSNVATATLPDGGQLAYSYDTNANLVKVTYPDTSAKQYLYNESTLNGGTSQLDALTGDIDETNTRVSSVGYDTQGRATLSQLGTNIEQTQVSYSSSGGSTVTYATGAKTTFGTTIINDVTLSPSISAACGTMCGQPYQTSAFDANGRPMSRTDFNGNVTKTTFDNNGLLDQQIYASGTTSQRTTNFSWNTALRVPLTRVVLDANGNVVSATQWIYNSNGQTLARCEIDPANSAASGYTCSNTGTVPAGVRRWIYTYCTAVDTTQCPIVGLTLTATGPRTDIAQTTTYSYYMASSATNCGTPGAACYQAGDLHTVTDATGHATTIASYDADGRATRITDANGISTDVSYTPRGWLASRSVGGATTGFTYTPYGAVQTVTDPDGVVTTYGYDTAHRLVKITDAQGGYIQYTLDAAGNKTAEQVYDTSGSLHKSLSRSFNTLGQLTKVTDGLNHTIFDASASNSYDANGNLVQSADGLGVQRQQGYDALNRLVQTIDNYNGTN